MSTKKETSTRYKSTFSPSASSLNVLRNGRILSPDEQPNEMVERIVSDLVSAEIKFGTDKHQAKEFSDLLGSQLDNQKIVFSTPIMTNAGKAAHRPLSACVVPPVNLRGDMRQVRAMINTYHQEAMGTGFDLSEVDDPVATLLFLNEVATAGAEGGLEDRPVGNMATCRVDHPKIMEFIASKANLRNVSWKFNISIDLPDQFWDAVERGANWQLRDRKTIKAEDILDAISNSSYICADPGIISLDRMNNDNPTPGVGRYTSTAPCAEVGLVPGETCQFGYLNLSKYIDASNGSVKYDELAESTKLMTRALDDALEQSIDRFGVRISAEVMSQKRKIGIGICGLADMLLNLGLPYDSEAGRDLCRDILTFINYQSKLSSVELAKTRGSFIAMYLPIGCRYTDSPGFIEDKYGSLDTDQISADDWIKLGKQIRVSRLLRNSSTIALPPTGRSGLVIDASTGVEPLFSLATNSTVHPSVVRILNGSTQADPHLFEHIAESGSAQQTHLSSKIKKLLETGPEISPQGHLLMVAKLQQSVDESISKTINLPNDSKPASIKEIYYQAFKHGLKGVTIYRNGSINSQPIRVSE